MLVRVSITVVAFCLLYGTIFLYELKSYNELGFFMLKLFVIAMTTRELYCCSLGSGKHYYFLNVGLLISAVINLVLFSFGNLLTAVSASTQKSLWTLNGLIFIVSLVLIFYELLLTKQERGR